MANDTLPPEVTALPVDMTPELREQIKAASPHCALIAVVLANNVRVIREVGR